MVGGEGGSVPDIHSCQVANGMHVLAIALLHCQTKNGHPLCKHAHPIKEGGVKMIVCCKKPILHHLQQGTHLEPPLPLGVVGFVTAKESIFGPFQGTVALAPPVPRAWQL